MKKVLFLLLFVQTIIYSQQLESPDKNFKFNFYLENDQPKYSLTYKNKEIIAKSSLGLAFKQADLTKNFKVLETKHSTFNESWKPVLGEYSEINNNYNQLKISLNQDQANVILNLTFRLFNDGLAFRYEIPNQKLVHYLELIEEKSNFNLTSDYKTFWIPADFDSQEYVYNETLLSQIDNEKLNLNNGIALKSIGGKYAVQSPLMMKSKDGIYLNIFEAAVDNFPVMHLNVDVNKYSLTSLLPKNTVESKAFLRTPFNSPWRTIIASDDARKIISANNMILNLNEPSKIEDTSWIKPMKYVGIWWEMHVQKSTWDYAGTQNAAQTLNASGKHGATTQNTKKYIDFASKHGFDGVLVEGWNAGWEDWFGNWKEDVFDFVTPYPDYNLDEIYKYAKSKNVKMIMHHETSGSVSNYERWLDRAMNLMKKYEYPAVKTGYVGRIIPRGEYHDGQIMVNHFNHVAKRMAENKLMINSHESSRPTGFHRTYPNYIAAEAARGNEFNAWSEGNTPAHETILPFTRLMGGPMDYTPGIFETKMNIYDSKIKSQVHTTLVKQLALYITMYSPLQMAADLPENYEKYIDAFQFIKDVPLDWQDSKILEAEPGDFITIVRKDKKSENWFLGSITDENARNTEIKLDFLTQNKKYEATIYEDGKDADYQLNPKSYKIRKIVVDSKSKIKLNLAKSGGSAISFKIL